MSDDVLGKMIAGVIASIFAGYFLYCDKWANEQKNLFKESYLYKNSKEMSIDPRRSYQLFKKYTNY